MSLEDYFEHARRELFPKLKESAIAITILGDPDPKLCMELGASILFDKPLLVVVLRGQRVPLALRMVANKIVEIDDMNSEADRSAVSKAIREMFEASRFRGGQQA